MIDTSSLAFGGHLLGQHARQVVHDHAVQGRDRARSRSPRPPATRCRPTAPPSARRRRSPPTPSYVGSVVSVRFAPTDSVTYNAELTVAHSSLTPDYGNTVAQHQAGRDRADRQRQGGDLGNAGDGDLADVLGHDHRPRRDDRRRDQRDDRDADRPRRTRTSTTRRRASTRPTASGRPNRRATPAATSSSRSR